MALCPRKRGKKPRSGLQPVTAREQPLRPGDEPYCHRSRDDKRKRNAHVALTEEPIADGVDHVEERVRV